jgi:hypothetical protein
MLNAAGEYNCGADVKPASISIATDGSAKRTQQGKAVETSTVWGLIVMDDRFHKKVEELKKIPESEDWAKSRYTQE